MKIDLNADLGEGCASDAELLTLVSSANIACGFHAGDAQTMQACVREAIKNGVAIGAHPSFPDRENFGRSAMQLPPETVYAQTLYQIGALATIARAQGGVMRHVKPHGMLYNQAAKEAQLADAIARAVYACDPALVLVGLTGNHKAKDLNAAQLDALAHALLEIPRFSYATRGQVDENKHHGALFRFKVFHRDGELCERCGGIIEKTTLSSRPFYWCPGCQH